VAGIFQLDEACVKHFVWIAILRQPDIGEGRCKLQLDLQAVNSEKVGIGWRHARTHQSLTMAESVKLILSHFSAEKRYWPLFRNLGSDPKGTM
jgi:hypothetical protein